MEILSNGVDWETGECIVPPIESDAFAKAILDSIAGRPPELRQAVHEGRRGLTLRGEAKRRPVDLGDPIAAGWTYLVAESDPQRDAIAAALEPLARHRGMPAGAKPLFYDAAAAERIADWLEQTLVGDAGNPGPHYVLIVGGPDLVPFRFQALLDTAASVGRVAFERMEDLAAYAEKVRRLETASAPVVSREAVVFATDAGPRDVTHLSRTLLAEPMAEAMETALGRAPHLVTDDSATRDAFLKACVEHNPALVFSATHGAAAPPQDEATCRRVNGAIVCARPTGELPKEAVVSAEHVPTTPLLEGGVLFQFACFSAGTPASSDFAHWFPRVRPVNATADFVAALPTRLLAHPRGPIACIGHVDLAFLHGFTDPIQPTWNQRHAPFTAAVRDLLALEPVGRAMEKMNARYAALNAVIANRTDAIQRRRIPDNADERARLADVFICRSDAQNYLILGDPAAHLRLPEE